MTAHGNLVAGEWVSGVETNRNLNPSNLDDVVGEYRDRLLQKLQEVLHHLTLRPAALDLVHTFDLEPAPQSGTEKRNG